jgi:hypothetical protein
VRAAVLLAEIYRNGDHGVAKNPIQAVKYAFRAIDLAVQTDPTDALHVNQFYEPVYEINAAHLLVEMAKSGEAVDAQGRPLLTLDEIDRLERYYGKVNAGSTKVNIRRLAPEIDCGLRDSRTKKFIIKWTISPSIWIWDWGRKESPTGLQIREILRKNPLCFYNLDRWRATLDDIFDQSNKSKLAFADLTNERISVLNGGEPPIRQPNRGRYR